jgi:two-component system chemotaxis response regulator CheB
VEALPRLIQQLPADFPAKVILVQHMAATRTPYLVDILRRNSPMPVAWGEQGAPIERAHIYVAPPDLHLLFTDDHIALSRGARENYSRPSIDRTFRSAAAVHGSRTIGVLLTGMLDDGVAGLIAIQDTGGIAIVQDPANAQFPELPSRALQAMQPDRVLTIEGIASALRGLAGHQVPVHPIPSTLKIEAALDHATQASPAELQKLGPQSPLACPDCAGPLWQVGDERQRRFRCYLGHVATAREMLERGDATVEAALWSAIRALNERATTLETLAHDTEESGNIQSASAYRQRAQDARTHADIAQQFMLEVTRVR